MKIRIVLLAGMLAAPGVAWADGKDRDGKDEKRDARVGEFLLGIQEVPVVSTTGFGTFRAEIGKERIEYKLTFHKLEGDVRQAHIHVGPKQNTGGIVLWLCQTSFNPAPAGTNPPPCFDEADPQTLRSNTVTGVLTPADVVPAAQHGIAEMEFEEIIALMRAGKTYVNVHSVKFPPGEIRSQIELDDHGDRDRGDHDRH